MAAVRNVGIVFVLGLVSFVIGFFLLARLLPAGNVASSTPPPVEAGTITSAANTPVATVSTTPTTTASPKRETVPPPRESKKDVEDSGPLLLSDDQNAKPPSEEVRPIQKTQTDQKTEPTTERTPGSEENNGDKKTTEPDSRSDTSTRSEARAGGESVGKAEANVEPKTKEGTPRRRRSKKSRSVLQPATEPDAPSTAPKTTDPVESASPTAPERTSRSVRRNRATGLTTPPSTKGEEPSPSVETNAKESVRRLYRVQVNVYSTEEAAKKEVDNLLDKHVTARVRKVVREGKTLYSVQQGAYRTKEKAQAAKDKLKEQGVEAYITGR